MKSSRQVKDLIKNISQKKGSMRSFFSEATHRGFEALLEEGEAILLEIFQSNHMEQLWNRYQLQYSYATDINWKAIEKAVLRLWKMSH